jgi:hypothetical protein
MIIVETPLKSIQLELAKLAKVDGPHAQLYAKGAIDALSWLVSGADPASEGGVSHFPPIAELTENVH